MNKRFGSMGSNTNVRSTVETIKAELLSATAWLDQALPGSTYTAKFGDGVKVKIGPVPQGEPK